MNELAITPSRVPGPSQTPLRDPKACFCRHNPLASTRYKRCELVPVGKGAAQSKCGPIRNETNFVARTQTHAGQAAGAHHENHRREEAQARAQRWGSVSAIASPHFSAPR
jgi:hypothetical protein